MVNKNDFLYARSRYYGQIKPENLAFNANLQEFSQRITYISNLVTSGKIPSHEAYQHIKALWKGLKLSKKQLKIGKETPETFSEDL
ncbi:hypothetical protein H6G04_02125 [Calothrix membranacea FACHB-236]|nr:hypothetical protein [Calothrix membranacea FACHB-236]